MPPSIVRSEVGVEILVVLVSVLQILSAHSPHPRLLVLVFRVRLDPSWFAIYTGTPGSTLSLPSFSSSSSLSLLLLPFLFLSLLSLSSSLPSFFPSCACVPYLHVCLRHTRAWCSLRSEEGIGCPETGVTDGSESLCGCWESNLEDQPVVLTGDRSLSPPPTHSICILVRFCASLENSKPMAQRRSSKV